MDLSIEVAARYIELVLGDSGVCNAVLFHAPRVHVWRQAVERYF